MASFNDSRCAAAGVRSTDPLLFTCEFNEVANLQLILPTGYRDNINVGSTVANTDPPAGFTAITVNVTVLNAKFRNILIIFSIANASLLNGGKITCDDTQGTKVMAGCVLQGRSICRDLGRRQS